MAQIYCIRNKINGKRYIGETLFTYQERFKEHLQSAKLYRKRDEKRPIYIAFEKYGIDNFEVFLIEECADEARWEREKYWIKYYDTYGANGYNANAGGIGNEKLLLDDQEVIDYYLQCECINETARHFECSKNAIAKRLQKYNIATIHTYHADSISEEMRAEIIDLYVIQHQTVKFIGNKFNMNSERIRNLLLEWNIPLELHRPTRVKLIGEEDNVINTYIKNKSVKLTAQLFNVDPTVINKILEEYNVPLYKNTAGAKSVSGTDLQTGEKISFKSRADAARWVISKGYAGGTVNSTAINIGRSVNGVRSTCCYGVKWDRK